MKDSILCFLIDDDLDDHEIFAMALEGIDRNIICAYANNGLKALEILDLDKSYVPDFIFLDVNMPKMNGLVCLEEIRRIDRLSNSKVIMYSTTSDTRIITRSLALGANDFLIKPTGIATLTEKLNDVLLASE